MTIKELMELTGAQLAVENADMEKEVTGGIACDLLSHVMGNGKSGMAWITVQTHVNAVAVAALHDLACVIAPDGIRWDEKSVSKAAEEGVILLTSERSAYALCGILYAGGVGR